jgi:probable HAF family extracellular repeat protein
MKQFSAIAQTFILTSFSVLSLFVVAPVQAASFRGLGFLGDGHYSSASGVSADGSVVVGQSGSNNGYEAFRWTQLSGMVGLGFLGRGNFLSGANDVSADGSVVVGYSDNAHGYEAFRWTQVGGMLGLGFLADVDSYSWGNGVSADGSIIVGKGGAIVIGQGVDFTFRWTQVGGMVGLGSLGSSASDISSDGSVIVGSISSGNGYQAYRWTQAGGMVSLGDLGGGNFSSDATGVSADGSFVVGYSDRVVGSVHVYGSEAFRWAEAYGMVGLGYLNMSSRAYDLSADGYSIVGDSDGEAFLWTQGRGMVSLKETLIGEGLDLSGWSLTSAKAISADGLTIVGNGRNPSGQGEAWVANLSPEPIPEPLTILGSMAAIAFAAGFERKFNKNKSDEKDPDA